MVEKVWTLAMHDSLINKHEHGETNGVNYHILRRFLRSWKYWYEYLEGFLEVENPNV
jgi:hypothetical protein